ncbi:DUF4998 domain-containing protein [uncultured Proteiniphilum sp.]|uniref:DUF4998 domain-containing protein n=1 Tax=uncultured Proteiniphilum sp. TaxID=497637 RepID=UPI002626FD81|nr:DUF4998 domain-containing protein [uncultured Proteiniphilum sp.]
MKKNHISLIILGMLLMIRCSDMNDVHKEFLQDGERVYIGKVDSMRVLPGDERFMLRFWVSDPRAKSVTFYWVPEDDSLYYELHRVSPYDPFEVIIGGSGSTKTINEGSYTLQAITSDNLGHYSLRTEKNINVYGEKYRSSLLNRVLNASEYDEEQNSLKLEFSGPFNEDDTGVEVRYTDMEGVENTVRFVDSLLTSPVFISGFDVPKGVSYRTMYLPDSLAIDTFYTAYAPAEIAMTVNVALNKPATVSGVNSVNDTADKAVDGIIANNSRWVSPASGVHWLEIDLQEDYTINGFKTWTGNAGLLSHPTGNFFFQAWINGEWINVVEVTGNTNPEYGASFPEVITDKVRYYVPEYSENRVRLYEIAVYTVVRY